MDNLFVCSPRQARSFIIQILEAGLVPYVESSPGCGKSTIMASIAKDFGLKMIDHRLSTSEPTDLSGLPHFTENGEAAFAPFAELFPLTDTPLVPGTNGWMLFLDEFPSARKETQAAAYKLILDHMVGQHHLHERCVITAAGNRRNDRALTNPISTAMASRLVHLELQVNQKEWMEDVAIPNNYDHRIIAFLSQYPGKLDTFDPASKERTFCCPRTWEFVNKLIYGRQLTDEAAILLAGTINSGVAVEFVQYTRLFNEIPSVAVILAAPETTQVPNEASLKWAIISALLEHANETNLDKLTKYVDRFTADFRILFYKSVNIRNPALRAHPAFTNAMRELSRYLFS